MARKSEAVDAAANGATPFDDWFVLQGRLFDAGVNQLASVQNAWFTAWWQMQNQLTQQWQAQANETMQRLSGKTVAARDGDVPAVLWPSAFAEPMLRAASAYWPWAGMWSRGTEQLA